MIEIHLGTRGSALARWQTDHVSDLLRASWPEMTIQTQVITTQGDRVQEKPLAMIGGKGVFTEELEAALRARTIDFAVHSLKDLPTENAPGLTIGAILERANVHDALISRTGSPLANLPPGAAIGTSSRRRAAQLLRQRPDIRTADIRGNVDTRIRKALDPAGEYDAIVLASAGLERLGQAAVITERLSLDDMLPAPGQGAMAVQCRDEAESLAVLAPLNHLQTQIAVTGERAFLAGLGGGCSLPIAAYGHVDEMKLYLRGRVTSLDGREQVDVSLEGPASPENARQMGAALAKMALEQGVERLLKDAETKE
jgi:hydroxymethylbilane synthase